MLKFFRDQKNSWLMKGILILTALSFVSLFRSGQIVDQIPDESKAVATVDGNKITVAEFINEMNMKVRAISKMAQAPFTMKDAVEGGMMTTQLDQMVSRAVMKASAAHLKLAIADDTVRNVVKNISEFKNFDGTFSFSAYKKYLNEMGLTEKRFINDTTLDLNIRQLTNAVGSLSVVPEIIAETDYAIQNEKRSVEVFTIIPSSLKIPGKPTEEEKEKLYKEMSEELTSPEYRSFTVMHLTPEIVSKQINVTEEEMQELFNETKDSYTVEEIRDVDQMLFSTKEEADKAYAALQKGEKFLTVAKNLAHQTEDQTKLGDVTPSTATSDWADLVFNAQKGEIIPPVQTTFGWQILRVNKITPKIEKSYKQVREEIKKKLVDSLTFDTLMEKAVELDDRFGAGETIESVAQSNGLPIKKYTLVDPSGKTEDGKETGLSKNILSVAFMREAGKESPMTEEGTGFFVLRVDDIQDPAIKPIEKSQKEIQAEWLEEKQREKARSIALEIESSLNKGMTAKAVSKKTGISYKTLESITRHDTQLPESVMYRLFNEPVNTVVKQPSSSEYLIAKTVSITPANIKKGKDELKKLNQTLQAQLAKSKADTVLADFGHYLNLKINEDITQKAFDYLTKSVQKANEEEEE